MLLAVAPLLALSVEGLVSTAWTVLQVALGLGFVIFVHELGHFAVAKMCGVRCDKFFLGFDVGGYKVSQKWGETEYGIGVLPLGGYVKMLGQEDTVASLEEQLAKSRAMEGSPDAVQVTGPDGQKQWVDRRSYLAKSVPQRMAIISAGVIMNVIFAVVFAAIAFGVGAPEQPAVVGATTPGGAAWRAGLRPGDRIVELNGLTDPSYKQLQEGVLLGDTDKGVSLVVERAGSEPRTLTILPDLDGPLPMIGVTPSPSTRVDRAGDPVLPNTPAAAAAKSGAGFERGDLVVAIDGEPVAAYGELVGELIDRKAQQITYTVLRGAKAPATNPFGELKGGEKVDVTIDANPLETLGVVVALGPVASVQQGSPAADAGIEAGDQLIAIDGQPVASTAGLVGAETGAPLDPTRIDDAVHAKAKAGEAITLTIIPAGAKGAAVKDVSLTPRVVTWSDNAALGEDAPLVISSLGVACPLKADVIAVVEGSPAAAADLRAGDRLVEAKIIAGDEKSSSEAVKLTGGEDNWPLILAAIQDCAPETRVELQFDRGDKRLKAEMTPAPATDAYTYHRGVRLDELKRLRRAGSFGEALQFGLEETKSSLSGVFRFLQKIGGQIPVTALGGPITIATVAGQSAYEGIGSLLLALTMLSANLAVLNFLPIPMLDGGHMMFLLYEGITGRPASEKFMVGLHTAGFLFLVSLMAFVFALDLGLIPRGL
ncbi:MAG: site-2 protease family protein [Lacipirellulaceae bacterium]